MIKGADISSLLEVEACGGRFYDTEKTSPACRGGGPLAVEGFCCEDALVILKRRGVNLIRLRLWNDPYDENGTPYGAGTNDLNHTMELARRCKALDLPWLLDFHYSDFWADPGKQFVPKAWRNLDEDGLTKAVYGFTLATLERLRSENLLPTMVQIGNEISNGLLWPYGQSPNYMAIARFVSAGIRAVKKVDPSIQTVIHLDNGGWNGLYRSWFDSYLINGGVDFDCIGLSYYPFWHGPMEGLKHNLHNLAQRYRKPMLIAETSMAFTLEECSDREGLLREQKRGLAANEMTAAGVAYAMTPEGQARYLEDLWEVVCSVPEGLCRGFVWWEPAWLPVEGSGWTTPAGLAYVHEKGPGGNEWANQGWFDYDGKALPVLKTVEEL